ncbi:cytochrome b/b6 domain-containing protein [Tropicimonas sp. IMCC34043]|uniref:cytochrome b/b6 domain-containing protein n=1 Tax=Tropicimonas sp. IMCC34043 TaxID=2248760 RepID=UPI000E2238FB|nr:cytochrome b/b6 domain-containing protein [Tropicimonas sp. IMCC34043]
MAGESRNPHELHKVRLWDPGLRLFHWALAICVTAAWLLGEFGPGIMTLHFYFGYAVIGLLAFRLIWGLFGPWPARFRDFLYGAGTVSRYLRGARARKPSYWPGHNPIGALSVFAVLGALALQVYTGLYSNPDDFINYGPLYDPAGAGASTWATGVHRAMAPVILALILLHIGAIVFYKVWKRENLVTPMITGLKVVEGPVPAGRVIEKVTDRAA